MNARFGEGLGDRRREGREQVDESRTRDPVNQPTVEAMRAEGAARFGILKNFEWRQDPRRFLFSQARYKFVAKLLSGRRDVLEIGCGDAFNAPIVLQEVQGLVVTDFDPLFIADALERMAPPWTFEALVHDFTERSMDRCFSAFYSLDVLEHLPEAAERRWLDNICASMSIDGVGIIGMPSLESQAYASPGSKEGHINCKSAPDLKKLMESYFDNVFMFSMNDEVVHTGFHKMAHYVIGVGAGLRRWEDQRKG